MNYTLNDDISSLCWLYKETVDKSLEREIFDAFNSKFSSRLDYNILVELLLKNNIEDLACKAKNVYFAALVNEFLTASKGVEFIDVKHSYSALLEKLSTSSCVDIYKHYIAVSRSLAGCQHFFSKSFNASDLIDSSLDRVGWGYKRSLYCNVIDKIVKHNADFSECSVVVISNKSDCFFMNTLLELREQASAIGAKIVFVSNNSENQTEAVLEVVDTFIQLKSNYGDCLPRNIGALFSRADILIFLDDDGMPGNNLLKTHYDIQRSRNILTLRGSCLPVSGGDVPAHYWLGRFERFAPPVLEGNCSFKAIAFFEVGGWGDYLYFGHGGYEICYKLINSISTPSQHLYSSVPVLYHNWSKPESQLNIKLLKFHALWHLLRFRYPDFHKFKKLFD